MKSDVASIALVIVLLVLLAKFIIIPNLPDRGPQKTATEFFREVTGDK